MPPTNAVEGTVWFDATNERQYTYQQGLWIDPTTATRTRYISVDPDVVNYIEAVEAADGEPLEQEVVTALEAFILGCKVDGIWSAIKTGCVLAGARTIAGAITPISGTAIPSYTDTSSFSVDYNRKTGLYRQGTNSQWFYTNYSNTILSNSNRHIALYITSAPTLPAAGGNPRLLLYAGIPYNGSTGIGVSGNTGNYFTSLSGAQAATGVAASQLGFLGTTRNDATNLTFRANSLDVPLVGASQTPHNSNLVLNGENVNSLGASQRTAFYSIGENIDLAKLDNRVTKLMAQLNTAIV
jgi:hypothetical protein